MSLYLRRHLHYRQASWTRGLRWPFGNWATVSLTMSFLMELLGCWMHCHARNRLPLAGLDIIFSISRHKRRATSWSCVSGTHIGRCIHSSGGSRREFRLLTHFTHSNKHNRSRSEFGVSFAYASAYLAKPSIIATFIGLPTEMRYNFLAWNPMTHGNITFVIFLCSVRYANFAQ